MSDRQTPVENIQETNTLVGDCIGLRLSDKHNNEIFINLNSSMTFGKLKKLLSDSAFSYWDQEINEDDTLKQLGIQNGDTIDLVRKQQASCGFKALRKEKANSFMKQEASEMNEFIALKIIAQDNSEFNFKVKLSADFWELKKSYSDTLGVPVSSLRFLFGGRYISDDETAEQLGMLDGDFIEVYQVAYDSWQNKPIDQVIKSINASLPQGLIVNSFNLVISNSGIITTNPKKETYAEKIFPNEANNLFMPKPILSLIDDSIEEYIKLKIVSHNSNSEMYYRLKLSSKLGKLKHSYCDRQGIPVSKSVFIFLGKLINDDDTPAKLGMIDDDTIDHIFHANSSSGKTHSGESKSIDRFIPSDLNMGSFSVVFDD